MLLVSYKTLIAAATVSFAGAIFVSAQETPVTPETPVTLPAPTPEVTPSVPAPVTPVAPAPTPPTPRFPRESGRGGPNGGGFQGGPNGGPNGGGNFGMNSGPMNPPNRDNEIVGPIILVDESLPQIISLLEKYSGKMILRTQTLPILRINFNGTAALTRKQAILALESLLAINGVAIVPQGDHFYKAIPITTATVESPPLYVESTLDLEPTERIIARLFTLNNTTAQVIEPALQVLVNRTRGGSVISMPTANAILFTDAVAAVQKAELIVEKLDAPNSVMFFPVKNIRASDVMKQFRTLQAGGLRNILSGDITIEADDLANQVLIVTPAQNREKIREIIAQIDVESLPQTSSERVGLRHAEAATVVSVLERVVTGNSSVSSTSAGGQLGSSNTFTSGGSSLGGTTSRTGGSNTAYRTFGFSTRTGTGANRTGGGATNTANQPQVAANSEAPNTFSNYLSVVADERSNSLVVFGTANDIKQVKEIVSRVDVPLAQVRMEAIIVEVTLSDQSASGLSTLGLGYVKGGNSVANPTYSFSTTTPALQGGDIPFSISGSVKELSLDMVLNKAENDSRVRVLSAPLISTSHNKVASIIVSRRQPIITGTTTSMEYSSSRSSSVDYQNIGLELNILPKVGENGAVEVQVSQQIQNIVGTTTIDGNDQPIIANRQAESYLTVQDGETIVLAGLQSYRETTSKGKMWLLGYIPLIGELFKPKTTDNERTEIIIFLKPHIVEQNEVQDSTPGLQPGSLTRVDARSYIETGRFSAVSLTKDEREALEVIRKRQDEQAKAARDAIDKETALKKEETL